MASRLRSISKQISAFRARAEVATGNALDWAFLRGSLVQSGLTPYETLLSGDPMSLRYYPPPYGKFRPHAASQSGAIFRSAWLPCLYD